jgi:hypothetical protein
MSAGNTLKVIGKEIAAGSGMTITGTVIETGTIVRKNGIGSTIIGNTIAGSSPLSRLPDGQQRAGREGLEFFGKKEDIK